MTDSLNVLRSQAIRDLIYRIGEITIAWSLLEASIDFCIDEIHSHHGGADIGEELPQTAFNRKIKYIKKWASRTIASDSKRLILDSLEKCKRMAGVRQVFIHGVYVNLPEYSELGYAEIEARDRNDRSQYQRSKTDAKRMNAFREQCLDVARGWLLLSMRLEQIRKNGENVRDAL